MLFETYQKQLLVPENVTREELRICFMGKLGEKAMYTGLILAVGIAYYKKDKRHDCRVEVLRDRLMNR